MGRPSRDMRYRATGFAAVVGMLIFSTSMAEASKPWLTDLNEGKRLASEQGKDLLINFTGTEWCGPCMEFESYVLDKPGFAPAGEHFILVELEFPAAEEDLPQEVREAYIAWKNRYGIHAFPTVILADAAGLPYAITGHLGLGPEEYVRHLSALRKIRGRRDAAFAKAAESQGLEKARYLDEALSALREGFAEPNASRQGDPLVRFYQPRIEEILVLAAAEDIAILRDKYQDVLKADEEQHRIAMIYDQLDVIQKEEGIDAAIRFIDRELERTRSTELRNRLRKSRLIFLEWADRNQEALAFAKELAQDDSYSPEEKRRIRERIAFNLKNLGQIDEAVAIYDGLIAAVAGDRKATWGYYHDKAEYLTIFGRFREALESCEAARQYVEPGTSDWRDNEFFRAKLMARLGRPADAAAVLDAAVKFEGLHPLDRAGMLAEAALILSKVGHRGEALERARRAEEILEGAEPEQAEMSIAEFIRKKIEDARRETP